MLQQVASKAPHEHRTNNLMRMSSKILNLNVKGADVILSPQSHDANNLVEFEDKNEEGGES